MTEVEQSHLKNVSLIRKAEKGTMERSLQDLEQALRREVDPIHKELAKWRAKSKTKDVWFR